MPKDIDRAVRLLQAASLAGNVDAEVEYAIALFNGTGRRTRPRGGAAAQGRQAKQPDRAKPPRPRAGERTGRAGGQGRGLKWHIVAKTAGKGDPLLDEALATLSPEDRAAAQEAARKWLGGK